MNRFLLFLFSAMLHCAPSSKMHGVSNQDIKREMQPGPQQKKLPVRINFKPVKPADSSRLVFVQAFKMKQIEVITDDEFAELIKEKAKETIELLRQGVGAIEATERQPDFANIVNIDFAGGNDDSAYLSIKWNITYYPPKQNRPAVPYRFFNIYDPKPYNEVVHQLVDTIAASGLLK